MYNLAAKSSGAMESCWTFWQVHCTFYTKAQTHYGLGMWSVNKSYRHFLSLKLSAHKDRKHGISATPGNDNSYWRAADCVCRTELRHLRQILLLLNSQLRAAASRFPVPFHRSRDRKSICSWTICNQVKSSKQQMATIYMNMNKTTEPLRGGTWICKPSVL